MIYISFRGTNLELDRAAQTAVDVTNQDCLGLGRHSSGLGDCLTKTNEWSDKPDDDCLDLSEDDDKQRCYK